jgi:thermostable 8-oxoguanine DNA glycosylase
MKEKKTTRAIKRIETKDELCTEDFKYDYNPDLTKVLDSIKDDFDQQIINMIALWKVNRYPYIPEDALAVLNEIRNDTEIMKHHEELLLRLLDCKGLQLPMASTLLRFRNPRLFQIIDQHVYRLLTGTELSLPVFPSEKNKKSICETYFDYLRVLRAKCKALDIPFEQADRILYNADKRINKGVKLKNYGG